MQKRKPAETQNSRYATFNLLKVMQPGELFVFMLLEPEKTRPVVRMVKMIERGTSPGRRGAPYPLVFKDVVTGEEVTFMFSVTHYPKNLISAQTVRLSAVQNNPLDYDEEDSVEVDELDFGGDS